MGNLHSKHDFPYCSVPSGSWLLFFSLTFLFPGSFLMKWNRHSKAVCHLPASPTACCVEVWKPEVGNCGSHSSVSSLLQKLGRSVKCKEQNALISESFNVYIWFWLMPATHFYTQDLFCLLKSSRNPKDVVIGYYNTKCLQRYLFKSSLGSTNVLDMRYQWNKSHQDLWKLQQI